MDIEPQGEALDEYHDVMAAAFETLSRQIASGATQGEASQAVMGLLSTARRLLGMAKIANPATVDLIDEVVEAKGACLVFAHHREVIAELAAQLRGLGRSVAIVRGDTPAHARAEAETDFQEGRIEVFLGSINAAGEALTLTRADTCIFIELDWVPATMHQAEDRGHRPGQDAPGYHIISLIAHLSGGVNLDEQVAGVLVEKLRDINTMLDENAGIEGERVFDRDDTAVRARVIAALMSADQRAAAAANAEQKAAKKRSKQQAAKKERKATSN